MSSPENPEVAAVAALHEPTRRRLFDLVTHSPAPVSRDEIAEATGLPRTTTTFHLDRLVKEGLLDVVHARRSGRTGPGAGRPAKLYQRSQRQLHVSIPPRHYDLAGHLLAGAIEEATRTGKDAARILEQRAHRAGRDLGRTLPPTTVAAALEQYGYEPHATDADIVLTNCPFHTLAGDYPTTVCHMNLHLITGLLEGLDQSEWLAQLDPAPGHCCVRLNPQPH